MLTFINVHFSEKTKIFRYDTLPCYLRLDTPDGDIGLHFPKETSAELIDNMESAFLAIFPRKDNEAPLPPPHPSKELS